MSDAIFEVWFVPAKYL